MRKRLRKKIYQYYFDDILIDISQSSYWRKKLFESKYFEEFILTYENLDEIPENLRDDFKKNKLKYYVSKVISCPEEFDEALIIFKFKANGFKNLIRYSGNNPDVI